MIESAVTHDPLTHTYSRRTGAVRIPWALGPWGWNSLLEHFLSETLTLSLTDSHSHSHHTVIFGAAAALLRTPGP